MCYENWSLGVDRNQFEDYWLPSRGVAEQRVSFIVCPLCSHTWLTNVLHASKQNKILPVVDEFAGIQAYI